MLAGLSGSSLDEVLPSPLYILCMYVFVALLRFPPFYAVAGPLLWGVATGDWMLALVAVALSGALVPMVSLNRKP